MRDIDEANWEFAHCLLQCVAVAFRPLRVEELADMLSFDFKTGPIPRFHEGWRLGDPIDAVLSTTSSLLTIVDDPGSPVIQFSHFSVKEFLTSPRLAETNDIICRRYHISMTPAHKLIAQACLGILLHLNINVVTRDSLGEYPLVEYAARHWVDHARFEGVSGEIGDGMKRLFDPSKRHLAVWVWIYDPELSPFMPTTRVERPLQPEGSTLHYAVVCGLHTIVKFLVIRHAEDLHSQCFHDAFAPLHLAVRGGHEDIARVLLEHGADITSQTNERWTPLHIASQWGYEQVTSLLLEHGADATAQTNDGSTPLHLAVREGREDVARILLKHGADVASQTNDGSTPLHLASQEGVASLLLEHGADATARTDDGSTPLHLASQEEVISLLLEHGAGATAQTNDGSTPLHLAAREGHEEVARVLLEHGVDTSPQTNDGSTPLHIASQLGYEDIVFLLLAYGAYASPRTNDGSTPLHLALEKGYGQIAYLLLEHGADARARTNDGSTPLHIASQSGVEQIVFLLLECGADPAAETIDGYRSTPLSLGLEWGGEAVTCLLLEHYNN